jgi:hypothetical protein
MTQGLQHQYHHHLLLLLLLLPRGSTTSTCRSSQRLMLQHKAPDKLQQAAENDTTITDSVATGKHYKMAC